MANTMKLGISPQEDYYRKQFNTPLAPQQEQGYQQWATQNRRDPVMEPIDYDLRGLYQAQQGFAANGHATDQFKKPNHPTFSDGSQYSGTPAPWGGTYQGGRWDAPNQLAMALGQIPADTRPSFTPSPQMLGTTHSQPQLQRYMKQYEPGYDLLLPYAPYRQASQPQLSDWIGKY